MEENVIIGRPRHFLLKTDEQTHTLAYVKGEGLYKNRLLKICDDATQKKKRCKTRMTRKTNDDFEKKANLREAFYGNQQH